MQIKIYLLFHARLLMYMLALSGIGKVTAQSITDTVFHVKAVVISAPRNEHFSNDIKTEEFFKDDLTVFAGESLTSFLANKTTLNIKSYGTGGAATNVTLRGTTASHVQVNWNGFPINSVTLGSYDFSFLPAGGFDRVSLAYGASGSLYGSGTFGGAVNLDNDLLIEKSSNGSVQLGYQSLKTLNGSVSFKTGSNKIAWDIHSWGAVSANEFHYYDYIRQSSRRQTDGDWNNVGVIQHLALKLSSSSIIEAGLWYQIKSFNIPSRIGSTSFEHQRDSTLKIFLGYKKYGNRWSIRLKTAAFNDEQKYWQKASAQSTANSIESNIVSLQWYSDFNFRYYFHPSLSLDAGLTGTYINADVSTYGENKVEKGLAAFAGIKYDYQSLVLHTTVRKEWSNTYHSGVLTSFGTAWEVIPDKFKLRANISQKFRKPTFNDLYWLPGGNGDLKPETGYSVETGSEVTFYSNEYIKVYSDLGLYMTHINDMIVWRPAGVYWMATNYQKVSSVGIDAGLFFKLQLEHFKFNSSLKATLNHSEVSTNSSDNGELMLYSPHLIISSENGFSKGIFYFIMWNHFTSGRYYDEDHLLDPYYTIDILTGVKINAGNGKVGIHTIINNITNTSYELIRLYPVPGRYLSIKLYYSF